MKRFWVGLVGGLLLAGGALSERIAAADELPNETAGKPVAKNPSERVSEAPRSESPSRTQRVLPLRAGDRRGGAPVWIGAMCFPADDTLRSQLSLDDGVGLIVARVMPESPADKAGLKVHDVVTAIDQRPIGDVAMLMAVVDGAGTQGLTLEFVRAGKKQTTTVVPVERPQGDVLDHPRIAVPENRPLEQQLRDQQARLVQDQIEKLRPRLSDADARQLQEWVERMRRGEDQSLRLQLFGPGLVIQNNPQAPVVQLPVGVNILIVRNTGVPTRITVTRGAERWDVTENELDKLPEDLREAVRAMVKP
jgi:membrane-associated protease RseP (regulator of RpoE activity)